MISALSRLAAEFVEQLPELMEDFRSQPLQFQVLCAVLGIAILILTALTLREAGRAVVGIKNWWTYRDMPPLEPFGFGSVIAPQAALPGNGEVNDDDDESDSGEDISSNRTTVIEGGATSAARPQRARTDTGEEEEMDFDLKTGQLVIRKKAPAPARPTPEGSTSIRAAPVERGVVVKRGATGAHNLRVMAPAPILRLSNEEAAAVAAKGGFVGGGVMVH